MIPTRAACALKTTKRAASRDLPQSRAASVALATSAALTRGLPISPPISGRYLELIHGANIINRLFTSSLAELSFAMIHFMLVTCGAH